jgi:type I restriction enzyme S subunit
MEILQPKLRFSEFDGDWELKKLSEVCTKIKDGTHFSPKTSNEIGDFQYLTSKNVKNGYIDFTNLQYITKKDHDKIYKSCDVKFGDVLLTKDGTIGQVCVNNLDYEFSLLSSVAYLRLKENYNNYFLYQLLVSEIGQNEINKAIAGQALKRITLTKINDFNFNFPTLPEQTRIAHFLSLIDEKITLLKEKKADLQEYKKGIMQKIFSQEIRFKDDNGDEFEEWVEKTLGEVADVNKGSQLNRDDLNDFEEYPSISGGIEPSGYTNEFNRNENTIIISEGGNSCGYVNFIKTKFWCGGHCYSIEIIGKDVSNTYLYQLLKYNQKQIMLLRVGSGLPNIQKKDLKKYKLNISKNLKEQIKIANFLSEIDEKISLVNNQIEDTQEYKKGLLQQIFV